MPEEFEDHTDYQKGFNEGYIVTKHMPELSGEIAKVESETVRLEGFRDGREQFVMDKLKDNRPGWMNPDRNTDKNINLPPSKDRSQDRDVEPER